VPAALGPGGAGVTRDEQDLTADLLRCYRLRAVEFRPHDWTFAARVGEKPIASPMARYQAAIGDTVTNLRHESTRLNEFSRTVLRLLDGTRDRAAILGRLGGSGRSDEAELARCLERLAGFALLCG
jgi:methyltransferase-like protein